MLSVGITTFEHRFDKYFVPLLSGLKKIDPDIEVIVAVNGEHNRPFSEEYRAKMLAFLSCIYPSTAGMKNVYPVFFPEFRGLAKLWNILLIHSTNPYVLVLNDDVLIENPDFVKDIKACLKANEGRTFYINWSWSHFVANKDEIDRLGYFDERLLGIGEEEGDMTWRYLAAFGIRIPNFDIPGFINYSQETMFSYKPQNIKCHSGTKYSAFNRDLIYTVKYKPDDKGIKGMFDFPMLPHLPNKQQYPYERFFAEYKQEL